MRYCVTLMAFVCVVFSVATAQNIETPRDIVERAFSLISENRYVDARHELERARKYVSTKNVDLSDRIAYGIAVCAASLNDNCQEEVLEDFLVKHPNSVYTNDVRFRLGKYFCTIEDYARSQEYLEQVSYKTLSKTEAVEYDFRIGYDEFMIGNFNRAYENFRKVPQASVYFPHATYYMGYIEYSKGSYDDAYVKFYSIREHDSYSSIVPYYLLQIEFSRKNYNYVVREGEKLVAKTSDDKKPLIYRIMAESWFRMDNFAKSAANMKMYARTTSEMKREDNYLLGYCSYRITDYRTAIESLKKVAAQKDLMGQNAAYHLADCYLRTGDKKSAISAFAMAADDSFRNDITRDALFNYGKLLFETGGGTFNEPINVLTRYIETYPKSNKIREARELLVAAYYNTSNYDMAYQAISQIPNPDASIRVALQKISFFNGISAFKGGDYEKARQQFSQSESMGVSPKYKALSSFWLGEVAYRQKDYKLAIEKYTLFTKRSPKGSEEYSMALYGMGYSNLECEKYPEAKKAFEGFLWLYKTQDAYRADSYNRLGDAEFSQNNYQEALFSYDKASQMMAPECYYASYYKAITLGLLNRVSDKIALLKKIVAEDKGNYLDEAMFELGHTYIKTQKYGEGARTLEQFVERYPDSGNRNQALLNLGLAYVNLGNTEKSLERYDEVIRNNPTDASAKTAMLSVREIYVEKGDIDGYFRYASRSGVECDLSNIMRDSLTFRVAEKTYLASRFHEAVSQFERYLGDFPKGYYMNESLFFLSDSYLKTGEEDSAIRTMTTLAERPQNTYTVPTLEKLSDLQSRKKEYLTAAGLCRRLYDLYHSSDDRKIAASKYVENTILSSSDDDILRMSEDIASMEDVTDQLRRRSQFARGSVLYSMGRETEGVDIFRTLAEDPSDKEGAEAAYREIYYLFSSGRLDDAEKKIYRLADSKTNHSYWLGRSFIILGDIYVQRNDTFQARATYQSVVDGYTPQTDGIVDEAKDRISKLK